MPREKISPELKKAIQALPLKEKEKLLFRLLPSNEILIRQLEYTLIEEGSTLQERRDILKDTIIAVLSKFPNRYSSPVYIALTLRELSGRINRHVRITKDKLGEISLNFLMLNYALEKNAARLNMADKWTSKKLDDYVAKRSLKLQKLLSKVHEDYVLEYEEDMKKLGNLILANPSMAENAKLLNVDIQALSKGLLPDNI